MSRVRQKRDGQECPSYRAQIYPAVFCYRLLVDDQFNRLFQQAFINYTYLVLIESSRLRMRGDVGSRDGTSYFVPGTHF